MGLIIFLLILGGFIYFLVWWKKKNERERRNNPAYTEYYRVLDQQKGIQTSIVDTTSKKSIKNRVIFNFEENETIKRKDIIAHYKSEYFLTGYCLKTNKIEVYDIQKITEFLDNSKPIFDALLPDPSLLRTDDIPITNHEKTQSNTSNKSHKKWDESNQNEIYFRYKSANGEVKNRVVRLINHTGDKITGYCNTAQGVRTFNIDKILTFYKDSQERLEKFIQNPHHNRDLLTISFVGFSNEQFEDYKGIGNIYNYRALKTITKNTSIVVYDNALTEAQTRRVEENQCALVKADNFAHFLETGEICLLEKFC